MSDAIVTLYRPEIDGVCPVGPFGRMTHRTETDGFGGHQIRPRHGLLFVREDKRLMAFQSRKIAWTEHCRHDHKKSNLDLIEKASRIRRTKVARGYAGKAADGGAKQATAAVKQRPGRRAGSE
jgi:ribosomal protein L24E